jgi:glycosyltransferase involved in cell wall biosynthesis
MLIIIPAYNEEQNVGRVVEKAKRRGKVLVIDDGSTDRTAQVAALAGADVMIHGKNLGYCASLQDGYYHALAKGEDMLVQLDADGQHDPAFIPQVSMPVLNKSADIVIGSRFLMGDYRVDFPKAIGMLFFRYLVRRLTGRIFTDTTSGFQCLSRTAIKYFLKEIFPVKYPDANVIIKCVRAGLRVQEVPVKMWPNPQGRSMHRGARKIARYMGAVMKDIVREVANG